MLSTAKYCVYRYGLGSTTQVVHQYHRLYESLVDGCIVSKPGDHVVFNWRGLFGDDTRDGIYHVDCSSGRCTLTTHRLPTWCIK